MGGVSGQALPTHQNIHQQGVFISPHTGQPTLQRQSGRDASGLSAQEGGLPGSFLRSEHSSLGFAGVCLLPDPHARTRPLTSPILPAPSSTLPLTWTGLAGTLSTGNFSQSTVDQACASKLYHPSPSSALGRW